ncbi:G-type lectin S-receptor-like serine/threonine-protein kinase LECRK2 [Salvia splendens]|uniref:G-type lectin S-receptor-like serine/threonine-protein kinase LECRK2 n=1 Tax=Salvia splendens TaxID=180675 RepID=UPI001C25921A|nr:G-type lectin S-receptor-like serine/threonine-protein kinase LECRK2 [Salvia splendens]
MSAAVVLLLLFFSGITSNADEVTKFPISLSSSLTPSTNSTWLSHSNKFAFGFYPTPNGYAVCVSFTSYFDKSRTVVWTANTDDPIVPDNAVMLLTEDGLVLKSTDSSETVVMIGNSSRPIGGAAMLDNGNFVLFDYHGSVTWQTFDHPTDCLVPGQSLSPGTQLLSHASETDLRKGMFRLKMQIDGNLVLYDSDSLDVSIDAYYESGTAGRGNNISLTLQNDGHLCLFDGTSVVMNITTGGNLTFEVLYLVRIDPDGIFRVYSRSWQPEDDWRPIYCGYKDVDAADCRCLPGYDRISSGVGCISNLVMDCSDKDQSSKFGMTRIQYVTWEDNYYSALDVSSEQGCEEACLKDCSCRVALYRNGQCRKQKLPLRYGRWQTVIEDVAFDLRCLFDIKGGTLICI